MERYLILGLSLVFLSFTPHNTTSDFGKVLESLSMKSTLLKKEVEYSIYFPPGYDESTRKYPIVYLLHGYTDDETAWVQFGEVNRYADEAIKKGIIPPMIIAMPDAGVTWYINDHAKEEPYEDFFFQEFIPTIEKDLRVRSKKEFRGIAGLSMGGYGALIYAMKHPDMFAASAPLSGGFYMADEYVSLDQNVWDQYWGKLYGRGLSGQERISDHLKANNPFFIAEAKGKEQLNKVRYYFDCGDDDFLYKGNAHLHVLLRDMEVPHEFRVRDGAHNWNYWRTGITDALKFIGESFHR